MAYRQMLLAGWEIQHLHVLGTNEDSPKVYPEMLPFGESQQATEQDPCLIQALKIQTDTKQQLELAPLQKALRAKYNPWVSLQKNHSPKDEPIPLAYMEILPGDPIPKFQEYERLTREEVARIPHEYAVCCRSPDIPLTAEGSKILDWFLRSLTVRLTVQKYNNSESLFPLFQDEDRNDGGIGELVSEIIE